MLPIEHPFAMTWMVTIGAIVWDSFGPPQSLEVSLVIKNSIPLWYMTLGLENPIACRLFCRHPLVIGLAQSFCTLERYFCMKHPFTCASDHLLITSEWSQEWICYHCNRRVYFLTFDRTNLRAHFVQSL